MSVEKGPNTISGLTLEEQLRQELDGLDVTELYEQSQSRTGIEDQLRHSTAARISPENCHPANANLQGQKDTEHRKLPRIPGKLLAAGAAGAMALGGAFGLGWLGTKHIIPRSSANGETLQRSLGKLYNPDSANIKEGVGTDVYRVHTCLGCNVWGVGGVFDTLDGKDYTAGVSSHLDLVLASTYKANEVSKPGYSWTTEQVSQPASSTHTAKTSEVTTVKVVNQALGVHMLDTHCLLDSNNQCIGGISKSTLEQALPALDVAIAVSPLRWAATIGSLVGLNSLSGLLNGSSSYGKRELATYDLSAKDLVSGCGPDLIENGALNGGLQSFFKALLSANAGIYSKKGASETAINLSQAASNQINVEVVNADGSPASGALYGIKMPSKVTAGEVSQLFGVSSGRVGSFGPNKGSSNGCSRSSITNTAGQVPAELAKTYANQPGSLVTKLLTGSTG